MPDNEVQAGSPISRGIRAFLVWCRMEKGPSRTSLEAYAADLDGFQAFVAPLSGEGYPDSEILVRYLNSLYQKDLRSRSIARHQSAVRSLFHFLLSEGLVSADPTEHLA